MNGMVWQRLDRALVNGDRSRLFACTKVIHLLRDRSYHAPLLIKCRDLGIRGSSFRFLNVWRKHPDFLDVIREAWQAPVHMGRIASFFWKLINTKRKLREWNVHVCGNIFSAIKSTEEVLGLRE